jgi:hypothetical protein
MQPGSDEFQVAVLGRGVGESIVLHVGEGRWLVVDSFVVPGANGAKTPAALHYLDSLGVERSAIVGVVVSHFDVDPTSANLVRTAGSVDERERVG